MRAWGTIWLWPLGAVDRLRKAVKRYWRRILVGAFVGWLFSVIGGAFSLASLEFWGVISNGTSDSIGIVTVLSGVATGGLIAYADRPAQRPSGVIARR